MGNLNCVENDIDRKYHQPGSRQRTAVSSTLQNVLNSLALVDIWKYLKPSDSGFTFHCQTCSTRLDRIYCDKSILRKFSNTETQPFVTTDHQSVIASFLPCTNVDKPRREPGVRKFNTSVLLDATFIAEMKNVIEKLAEEPLRKQDIR